MKVFGTMVILLDGHPEVGVHVLSEIGYLICLGYLFRSTHLLHVRNVF